MRRALWIAGRAAVSSVALLMALSRALLAQQPFDVDSPTPTPPAPQGTEQAVVSRYWELGRPRAFFATTTEAGYAYLRPRFTLGYGQPYWHWVGLETYPLLSLNGVGHYLGLGAALPGLTLRAGGRYTYPFSRDYLRPQPNFSRLDLERVGGPKADYLALEAELTATLPVFVGSAFAVLSGYRVELAAKGYFLYEESLRQVIEPPYVWRARLGYLVGLGQGSAIRIGAAGEVIGLPGRNEVVVRAGLLGSVLINAHLEAQASFIPVLVSPDRLGLAGGDFGQLGVRYSWATHSTPDPKRVRGVLAEKLRTQTPGEPQQR
jgi:hypothetical protein